MVRSWAHPSIVSKKTEKCILVFFFTFIFFVLWYHNEHINFASGANGKLF